MQFNRQLKTLKIYALIILILSLAISTYSKNLLSNNSNNSKSNKNIPNIKSKIEPKSSSSKSSETKKVEKLNSSFLQSSEKTLQSPKASDKKDTFDKYLATKMLLDLGRYLIRNFQNHETYLAYNKCIGSIKDKFSGFEPLLKPFWAEMYRISKNEDATELKNKDVILSIFKKLHEKNVKLENPKIEKKCKSVLIIQPKILRRDLNTVLTRNQYFGGVASMRQRPFIDSMFSVYRNHLPSNAFELLNKSSRGLESFKINSEGLTDIAVASPAERKNAHNPKKPGYAIEENYFRRIQNATFGNSYNSTRARFNSTLVTRNQKIHVINGNRSIDFPGAPEAHLENVEVSLDPSLAGKNIVIDRKITYPKAVERVVNNELQKSNLLPGLNGRVFNGTNAEEIYVHVRAEDEEANGAANNNNNDASNDSGVENNNVNGMQSAESADSAEMGVNEESDH